MTNFYQKNLLLHKKFYKQLFNPNFLLPIEIFNHKFFNYYAIYKFINQLIINHSIN